MQLVPHPWTFQRISLNICSFGLSLLHRWMCLWFCFHVAMLLWWFSDVPDAPDNLVLSELKSKSVKLNWIPGDDHNSSTTGKKEHVSVERIYRTYRMSSSRSDIHIKGVILYLNRLFDSILYNVSPWLIHPRVHYDKASLRNRPARSRVWGAFCSACG